MQKFICHCAHKLHYRCRHQHSTICMTAEAPQKFFPWSWCLTQTWTPHRAAPIASTFLCWRDQNPVELEKVELNFTCSSSGISALTLIQLDNVFGSLVHLPSRGFDHTVVKTNRLVPPKHQTKQSISAESWSATPAVQLPSVTQRMQLTNSTMNRTSSWASYVISVTFDKSKWTSWIRNMTMLWHQMHSGDCSLSAALFATLAGKHYIISQGHVCQRKFPTVCSYVNLRAFTQSPK